MQTFLQGGVELEKLPPTNDALSHPIKHAHFQARVWRQTSQPTQVLDSSVGRAWQKDIATNILNQH